MNPKSKLFYLFFLVTMVPVLCLGAFSLWQSTHTVNELTQDKLLAVANAKQAALERHLTALTSFTRSLAENKHIQSFLQGDVDAEASAQHALRNFQESNWGSSHHVFVSDPQGQVVISVPHGDATSSHLGEHVDDSPFFAKALQEVQVTDFFGFEEATHYHQLLMVPVKVNGQAVGVVIVEVEISYVMKILSENFDLGESGRAFLVTLDKQPVVRNKTDERVVLKQSQFADALAQGQVIGDFYNHKQESVVGAYLKSSRFPWIVAVEKSAAEAYASTAKLKWTLIVAILVLGPILLFLALKLADYWVVRPIKEVAHELTKNSGRIHDTSQLLDGSADDLKDSTASQAAAIEQSSACVEMLTQTVTSNKNLNETSVELCRRMKEASENCRESMQALRGAMEEIRSSYREIESLSQVIQQIHGETKIVDEIVFQTKLLSFNASVEAERAGEHGRGFSVVAQEVGNLAQMSGEAASKISQIVKSSLNQVADFTDRSRHRITEGDKRVQETSGLLDDIVESANSVLSNSRELLSAMEQQVSGIREINAGNSEMANSSMTVKVEAEKTGDFAKELRQSVAELDTVVRQLGELTGGPADSHKPSQVIHLDNWEGEMVEDAAATTDQAA